MSAADIAETYLTARSTALASGFSALEGAVERCITFTGGHMGSGAWAEAHGNVVGTVASGPDTAPFLLLW